jgi:predicted DNA-binding protein
MPARHRISFFLNSELESRLKALKQRVGIPQAEAIRRAIAEYLERQEKEIGLKTERKRGATRRRS